MSSPQGWFESDGDYRARVAEEANERVIEDSSGEAPRQGWFESHEGYRERIAQEAQERIVEDSGSADVFAGVDSKAARKCIPSALYHIARRRLGHLDQAASIKDLSSVPGHELHALKRDRVGQHAIRINDTYRICFV